MCLTTLGTFVSAQPRRIEQYAAAGAGKFVMNEDGGFHGSDQGDGEGGGRRLDGAVDRFLNRLLGLKVDEQDALFKFFSDSFDATVALARVEGRFEEGIVNLRANHISIEVRSIGELELTCLSLPHLLPCAYCN
jgi:hypothetical protein